MKERLMVASGPPQITKNLWKTDKRGLMGKVRSGRGLELLFYYL